MAASNTLKGRLFAGPIRDVRRRGDPRSPGVAQRSFAL
jgi:hypothetical protein